MFNRITNRHTKRKQQHLTSSKKRCAKDDIAYWPSVFKRAEDEDELRDNVDGDTDERPDDVDYEESDRFGVWETKELLEGGYGDEKGDAKYD